jgi:hydrogenase/urease accessory protein HupE
MSEQNIKSYQGLLLGHGALVVIVGFVGGFMLTFAMLGRVELWPLFSFDIQVPGDARAWRATHVGAITNGLLCAMGAVALPFITAGKARAFVAYGLLCTAWGNLMFYIFAAFGNVHGLSGGYVEGMGQANIFDMLAYIPAVIAASAATICMVLIALGGLKAAGNKD